MEQSRVHISGIGDGAQCGLAIPALGELLPGSLEDLFAGLRRPRAPSRLGHRVSLRHVAQPIIRRVLPGLRQINHRFSHAANSWLRRMAAPIASLPVSSGSGSEAFR